MKKSPGTVYLIHFQAPGLHHAGHYLGWALHLEERLEKHRSGNCSKLMAAVGLAGITWEVVRTWVGDRSLEKRLKVLKNSRLLCPICRAATLQRKAAQTRARYHKRKSSNPL